MEIKSEAIEFTKWLVLKNNLVPNKSFLWFDSKATNKEVEFFTIEELYSVFISGDSLDSFSKIREIETNNFFDDLNSKQQ